MAYNKKIQIQHCTETKDEIGNIVQEWTLFHEVWAEIKTAGSKEYYAASQVNTQSGITFKLRYSRVLSVMLPSELRIVYNDRIYDVKSVIDTDERHRETVIQAEIRNGESENE